jgi:dTDP-4-dehydrorhamnose 3,5-epimerase
MDERGLFGRTWCADEARALGLCQQFAQCSVSFNRTRGTLRGLHFQTAPYAETKLVRCTAGAIVDVVVDLRPDSPTFRRWVAEELTAENRRALYVPEGCAHGFQTLTDGAEVLYQITPAHQPGFSSGVRWDDPAFGIRWPDVPRALSERDRTWPDFAA